jgi:hypothetical protein
MVSENVGSYIDFFLLLDPNGHGVISMVWAEIFTTLYACKNVKIFIVKIYHEN